MKNHKRLLLLVSTVPLLGGLSGCGGGNSTTAPASTAGGGNNTAASTGGTNTTSSSSGNTSAASGTTTTLPSVKLDVLAPNIGGHPNNGIDKFDAVTGTELLDQSVFSITSGLSDGDLLAKKSADAFYVYDNDGYTPTIYTVTGGTKQALPSLPTTSSYSSAAAAMTILPNQNLLVATYTRAFSYNGFTTLQTDGTWSAYQLTHQYFIVRAMTVGPDKKLYVSGQQTGKERVDRYAISGDTLTFETTLLTASGNSQFGAIGFSHNGDMILADIGKSQLQTYTSSGGATSKLLRVPGLVRFVIGSSILKQNDEVLFVVSRDGIYRVDYTTGNFSAVDKDGNSNPKPFLPSPNGGTFKDLTLN